MEFNPSNKVIRHCVQGIELEEKDKPQDASRLFQQAWAEARAGMEPPFYVSAGYKAPLAIDDYFEALFAASTIVVGAVRSPATKLPSGGPAGGSSGGSEQFERLSLDPGCAAVSRMRAAGWREAG